MKSQPFTNEELEKMSLEELSEFWDKGLLSDTSKDYLIKKVPFLKLVRHIYDDDNIDSSPKLKINM